MKYRKKPVVIDAVKFDGTLGSIQELRSLGLDILPTSDAPEIKTLEGTLTASMGDYIIKGVKGEFYPCKPDIFEETYEKAEV